jgi:hypothetical protein
MELPAFVGEKMPIVEGGVMVTPYESIPNGIGVDACPGISDHADLPPLFRSCRHQERIRACE